MADLGGRRAPVIEPFVRKGVAAAWVAAACCCAAVACSTSYQPRANGQVSLIIHHGAAMYVKDGQEVPIGPLGGALQPLVASVPAAGTMAHRSHNQLAVGVPLYVAGVAALALRLFLLRGWEGSTALGVGATSTVTGLTLIGAGFTNAVDAVNIYNDAACAPRSPPP